jgi:hypothetical protein
MTSNKKDSENITSSDIKYILDVNQKAIEIYIEVEKQNEEIIEMLNNLDEKFKDNSEVLQLLKEHQQEIKNLLSTEVNIKNEQILDKLKDLLDLVKSIEKNDDSKNIIRNIEEMDEKLNKSSSKIESIDKNIFKILVVLGSGGVAILAKYFFL